MNTRARILLVDDHALFRSGVQTLLADAEDFLVVGEARSGEQALELLPRLQPDVVLMDMALPGMNGIAAARKCRELQPALQVIILSMYKEEEYVARALKAGVSGYVLKDATVQELTLAIRSARLGQTFISPSVSHLLIGPFVDGTAMGDPLTARQKQVLTLLARGLSAKQVAAELHLSTKTVETHRTQLMERLGLRNLPALVLYAVRHGLISAG